MTEEQLKQRLEILEVATPFIQGTLKRIAEIEAIVFYGLEEDERCSDG